MIQRMLQFGYSAFSKSSLNIYKFTVHILLEPGLENFDHYFTSVWDNCNCAVVWAFFGIAFLWGWNENWPFPVLRPLLAAADPFIIQCVLCAWSLCSVRLFVTPWTGTCQAPLSIQIPQARILEWVAMPSSRGSSRPRDQTQVLSIAGGFFTVWATREALSNV